MYNLLPKYLREIENVKTVKFKIELDKFLKTIPDQPKMLNYVTASGSNSILDQLTHLRAQRIYHSGGVPYCHGAVLAASKILQVSKYQVGLTWVPGGLHMDTRLATHGHQIGHTWAPGGPHMGTRWANYYQLTIITINIASCEQNCFAK